MTARLCLSGVTALVLCVAFACPRTLRAEESVADAAGTRPLRLRVIAAPGTTLVTEDGTSHATDERGRVNIEVEPRRHTLRLKRPGYKEQTLQIDGEGRRRVTVGAAPFEPDVRSQPGERMPPEASDPATGRILVRAWPGRCTLRCEALGWRSERMPGDAVAYFNVPPGLYLGTLSGHGWRLPWTLEVVAGEQTAITGYMLIGQVDVDTGELAFTYDEALMVEIDGRSHGNAVSHDDVGLRVQSLKAGTHEVRLTKRGYHPVSRTVEIVAGQTLDYGDPGMLPVLHVTTAEAEPEAQWLDGFAAIRIPDAPAGSTLRCEALGLEVSVTSTEGVGVYGIPEGSHALTLELGAQSIAYEGRLRAGLRRTLALDAEQGTLRAVRSWADEALVDETIEAWKRGTTAAWWEPDADRLLLAFRGRLMTLDLKTKTPGEAIETEGPVEHLAVAPDASFVIATGRGAHYVERSTGTSRVLRETRWGYRSPIVSSDGRTLAIANTSVRGTHVLDLPSGRKRFDVPLRETASVLCFTPDGRTLLVGTYQGEVLALDTADGRERWRSTVSGHGIVALAPSPDGRQLAVASRARRIYVVDLATGQEAAAMGTFEEPIVHLAFSPDGKALVSGHVSGHVRIYNAARWGSPRTLRPHRNGILLIAFDGPRERMLTVDRSGVVARWSLQD